MSGWTVPWTDADDIRIAPGIVVGRLKLDEKRAWNKGHGLKRTCASSTPKTKRRPAPQRRAVLQLPSRWLLAEGLENLSSIDPEFISRSGPVEFMSHDRAAFGAMNPKVVTLLSFWGPRDLGGNNE